MKVLQPGEAPDQVNPSWSIVSPGGHIHLGKNNQHYGRQTPRCMIEIETNPESSIIYLDREQLELMLAALEQVKEEGTWE